VLLNHRVGVLAGFLLSRPAAGSSCTGATHDRAGPSVSTAGPPTLRGSHATAAALGRGSNVAVARSGGSLSLPLAVSVAMSATGRSRWLSRPDDGKPCHLHRAPLLQLTARPPMPSSDRASARRGRGLPQLSPAWSSSPSASRRPAFPSPVPSVPSVSTPR
jgi:hypothetical protein